MVAVVDMSADANPLYLNAAVNVNAAVDAERRIRAAQVQHGHLKDAALYHQTIAAAAAVGAADRIKRRFDI